MTAHGILDEGDVPPEAHVPRVAVDPSESAQEGPMIQLVASVERALGAHVRAEDLTIPQIALRAILVFLVWLAIVRMADRRLLGKYSAFDVVLAVMLGSVLSRAINGSAPLWGTLAAATVLVAMHWIL